MTVTDIDPDSAEVDPDAFDPSAVYEELTDEEMAFVALMTDPSGIDQAEFLWSDDNPHPDGSIDGCFQAHPFQWPWWSSTEPRQIDQAARDVGKSTRIQARCCAFPWIYPGQEQAITAPEGTHLDKLTDALEVRIYNSWLLTQMVIGGRGGIRHRPFRLMWASGARLYCMLPQRSGLGVKGSHAVWLDVDEGQDVTERTWKELPETVRWEVPGAMWLVHGVSKGVIDDFYKMTQENSGWQVHRITSMHSPFWDEDEREQKEKDYTGRDNPDYLRNVYGEHGPAMNRIFVLNRLQACRDSIESSKYNTEEYYRVSVTDDHIAARVGGMEAVKTSSEAAIAALHDMLDFPHNHGNDRYPITWAGMDIGLVNDPSELLVFGEYELSSQERREHTKQQIAVPEPGTTRFKLLTRLKMRRIPEPLQKELIMWVIRFYRPRAFSLDKTGIGLNVLQELQQLAGTSRLFVIEPDDDATDEERRAFDEQRSQARNALTVIKGYNFKEKVLIDFDEEKAAELPGATMQELIDKAGIKQNAKDRATDVLRTLVDNSRLLIPEDAEILNDFNAATQQSSQEPVDAYGKRRMTYGGGSFHILDGARMFALGWSQQKIESIIAAPAPPQEPVYDLFLTP